MPMTSSLFSPTTGIREKPLRSASDSTCRTFLSRSAKTMSVRGTMTSRTIVSPNSNTEWIISRSPGSMTRRSPSRSTSTLRYRRGSARIACTAEELPFEPFLARSLPPALTMRNRAISALTHNPAATASATAAATSHAIAASPRFVPLHCVRYRPALGAPGVQQLVLQSEHGGMFPGLGMVETEQVEYAVGAQHLQFVGDRALRLAGLLGGHLRAQDHIAEHGGRPWVAGGVTDAVRAVAARGWRAQLVHGKREHVRGTFLAHPALVQIGDGGTIHQQYR